MSKKNNFKEIMPDARYGSVLVSKFINCFMWQGKKTVAENFFYGALDIVAKKIKDEPPLKVFETAINNIKPLVLLLVRVSGPG